MLRPSAMLAALAVVALLAGGALYVQWDAHMELTGRVMKVRSVNAVPEATLAVIDCRLNNTAGSTYVVGESTIQLEDAKGNKIDGVPIAEMDIDRVFTGFPELGQRYNPNLKMRDKLAPHTTADRQLSVQFPLTATAFAARKRLIVTVRELDGQESQILEAR